MELLVNLTKHITRKNVVTYVQTGPEPAVASVNLYKRIFAGDPPDTLQVTVRIPESA